ncbi:MAG TPA: four helix bundle protein [Candidatus Ozemobacteraceae bacterium]
MSIQSFQDLEVWKRAMDLAETTYRLTKTFPREELFGMVSQIRRASTSIPANIAEGRGRQGTREFLQFLRISQGSLRELETFLLLARRVGYCTELQIQPLLNETTILSKQLLALQRSLQSRSS